MKASSPKYRLPDYYGELRCVRVSQVEHLLMILDELGDELMENINKGSIKGFYCNRGWIIDAYKRDCLFGLQIPETTEMYDRSSESRFDPIFMKGRLWPFDAGLKHCCVSYSLPCFAIVDGGPGNKECSFLWVAERARSYGFGSMLVTECKVTTALVVVPESTGFWESIGFRLRTGSKSSSRSSWVLNTRSSNHRYI